MSDKTMEKMDIVRLYGQEVRDFSSQYGAEERMSYAAQNLAGPHSIYPSYGDFTQACVFRTYGPWWRLSPSAPKPYLKTPSPNDLGSEDFIEVLFSERLYPVAVHVYETYNPGAIVRIMGCDYRAGTDVDTGKQSRWRTLWSGGVVETPQRVHIFSPPIRRIDTPVNLIRIELNHKLLHYYTELDCVMLSGVRKKPSPQVYSSLQAQASNLSAGDLPSSDSAPPPLDMDGGEAGVAKSSGWWSLQKKENQEGDGEGAMLRNLESLRISAPPANPEPPSKQVFSILPEEIIVMILGYLDFPSLGHVAQTCRLLQRHAYDSILYTELNLQPVWNMVSDRTLEGLAQRCDHLQRLNLSWCSHWDPNHKQGFLSLLMSCRDTLNCLQLSCCSFVNAEILQAIVTHCPHLKELDLSGCVEVDKVSAIALIYMTDLERLNLYRTKVDTHTVVCIIRCMPNLKHLNLGSCKLISNSADVVLELGLCCPNLRSLDLWRARNMDNAAFHRFVNSCPLLEELDLGWCTQLTSRESVFTNIAEKCPNLKKLYLTANRTVCDADVLSMAKYSQHLEQLDILGTREVSSEAIEKLLTKCRNLIMVDVSFCACITDIDVAHWKDKYPHVNIKKSYQN